MSVLSGARTLEVWRVNLSDPTCVSFPSDINMGQKILVRLRPHFDPDAFLPEEDVVHTMLHEASQYPSSTLHPRGSSHVPCVPLPFQLTHNVHGPHDDSFYKYLAGLESEYEDLKRSGYSGEGFHSRGTRLGVDASHNLPPYQGRLKALEAAERRRGAGDSGGKRLGGGRAGTLDGGRRQLTPRELALRVSTVSYPHLDPPFLHSLGIAWKF